MWSLDDHAPRHSRGKTHNAQLDVLVVADCMFMKCQLLVRGSDVSHKKMHQSNLSASAKPQLILGLETKLFFCTGFTSHSGQEADRQRHSL